MQGIANVARQEAIDIARSTITDKIYGLMFNALAKMIPGGQFLTDLNKLPTTKAQGSLGDKLLKTSLEIAFHEAGVGDQLWLDPTVLENGNAVRNGRNSSLGTTPIPNIPWPGNGFARPDYIISNNAPVNGGAYLIGDIKLSVDSLHAQYVAGGKTVQRNAIFRYASNHTISRAALFLCIKGGNSSNYKALKSVIEKLDFQNKVIGIIITSGLK